MVELIKKVNIKHPIDVHSIVIQRDPIYPDAYVITLPLDSDPSYIWRAFFQEKVVAGLDFWERKVLIMGNELKLVTTPNNMEGKLNWIETLVVAANKRVEEYNENMKKKRKKEEITSEIEKTIRTALSRWLVRRTTARI